MGPSVKSISNMQDSIPNNKHVCKIFFRDMYTLAHFFFRGVQFSSFLVDLGHQNPYFLIPPLSYCDREHKRSIGYTWTRSLLKKKNSTFLQNFFSTFV